MLELLGWIAAVLFALCGAPQAWDCFIKGNAKGVSPAFIWMWFWGEVLMLGYTLGKVGFIGPFMLNYMVNLFFITVILKYMYWPRLAAKEDNFEASL